MGGHVLKFGWSRLALLAVAAACAAGAPSAARQEPAPQEGRIVVRAGNAVVWQEDGREVTFLTGQFSVRRGDFSLSGARAMGWRDQGSGRPFDELYVEGNVTISQGAQKIQAERLWYDFAVGRAVIVDLRGRAYSDDFKQTFYVRAREARMLMLGRLEASDIDVSTCSYGIPHYHVEVGRARLTGRDPRPPRDEWEIFPFRDWRFRVEDIYPEFTGAPIFFFPAVILGPWVKEFPIRSIRCGRSGRFGAFVYSEFGMRLKRMVEEHKPQTWGEVILEADWRQKRGGAYGLDFLYDWKGTRGYVDTYLLYDQGRDLDVEFESKFPPLEREERGRVRAFHRTELGPHWRFEAESWYLSDRGILEEFFEREFKQDKEPETAAYVRWIDGPLGAYAYERHRLNDFQTQNEFMPRLDFWMIGVPPAPSILDRLIMTEQMDVVHIRRTFDEELDLASRRTWRMDAVTELQWPLDFGPFQVAPFAQQRTTVYEDVPDGEGELRSIWTAGGRISTQVHATHPGVEWELVGLRGLRHVAELEARYAAAADCNVAASELYPFEEVERLGEFQEFSFEMRHRFKTRRDDGKPFEFLDVGVEIEYYPKRDRDTASERPDNWFPPFNWILLSPDARSGGYPGRHVSNVHYEALLQPLDFIRFAAGGEYNPEERREEVREALVWVNPFAGFTASASHNYVRGLTNAYRFTASWELTEKWKVSGAVQYDFRADEYVSKDLVVARDFHDFSMEIVVERDFGRDEHRVYLNFVPKFLGQSRRSRAPREAAGSAP